MAPPPVSPATASACARVKLGDLEAGQKGAYFQKQSRRAPKSRVSGPQGAIAEGKEGVLSQYLEDLSDPIRRVKVNDRDKNTGATLLHQAVKMKNNAILDMLLTYGADPNVKDKMGFTPLHYVAKFVRPEKRRVTDKQGRTALHNAATLGDAEVVRLLLSHGANIHAVDKKGLTPLHIAAKEGSLQAVCLLCQEIQKEASTDIPVAVLSRRDKQNKTPLHYAVENNHIEIVRFLLEKGVDPNCSSSTGLTALHLAAMRGGVPMCQLLMDHGAATDVLADGNKTPLFLAATNDRPRIVAFLLDKGAGIEDRDVEGNSPLLGAVDSGSVEVVRLLLDRGADIDSRNNDDRNVLHMAVLSKNEDVLQLLLAVKGSEQLINRKDCDGDTPLHHAARNAFLDIVQILLKRGARASAKNSSEETTLHAACHYNFPNVVREIVKQDARLVNETDIHWNTPLHVAAQGGFSETAAILVEAGAYLEAKNYYEWTPLTVACKNGDFDTVSNLLGAGASVNSVDKMKVGIGHVT
ncbi:hypothetical protein HPB52_007531 [Rhipicephalus sanguineus]|uniref:Uncharacterized protein n=1 Tax=Rhipicephalus sanguineus TaxID=34632 RepID=A0A9D4SSP6_RHISA|nr:hypothetical protein HPB52_007531 [Rhipicephalus sanguineus]